MRMCSVSKRKFRADLMSRVASIAILAGFVAGCSSDVSRFSEPFYAGSTPNQKTIIARQSPAPVDDTYTGSIGKKPARHIPSVNDVSHRASNQAVATHNPSFERPSGRNGITPVTQSKLDPLPPLPAKVASREPSKKTGPRLALPPLPERVKQVFSRGPQRKKTVEKQVAALPGSRSGAPQLPAHDPIETGSLPAVTRDERAPSPAAIASGWTSAGGSLITVGQGETGPSLARRYGVPLKAILVANNMSNANGIQPGQRVVIPTYIHSAANPAQSADSGLPQGPNAYKLLARAPVPKDRPGRVQKQVSNAAPVRGSSSTDLSNGHYAVRPGDSVAGISQKFGISPGGLRSVNGLAPDALLWIGQKLRIPSATGSTQVASLNAIQPVSDAPEKPSTQSYSATPAPKPSFSGKRKRVAAPKESQPVVSVQKVAKQKPEPTRVVVASRTDVKSDAGADPVKVAKKKAGLAKGQFSWPVKGPIISRFGRKANGERNDGINISVPHGAPVHAAEKGVVIYSGNELKGYGNLVLVRHAEGWVSAYAHNGKLKVARGDAIQKGQVIASAGDTGSVSEPQVHFELRRNSKPVDPIPLMVRK